MGHIWCCRLDPDFPWECERCHVKFSGELNKPPEPDAPVGVFTTEFAETRYFTCDELICMDVLKD